jgi:hypothetical protein
MTITANSPTRCEITIRRPNGETETVVWPHHVRLTADMFRTIAAQTAAAGRGEVLSYTNIAPTYQMTEAEKDERAMDDLIRQSWTRR